MRRPSEPDFLATRCSRLPIGVASCKEGLIIFSFRCCRQVHSSRRLHGRNSPSMSTRAGDGTAQQRIELPISDEYRLRTLFAQKKTYSASVEGYVGYFNGCCAQRDRITSSRARAVDVRVIPQGWEEPPVFPTIHKKGSTKPITRGSSRPSGGNFGT